MIFFIVEEILWFFFNLCCLVFGWCLAKFIFEGNQELKSLNDLMPKK